MLRRGPLWHALATEFARASFGLGGDDPLAIPPCGTPHGPGTGTTRSLTPLSFAHAQAEQRQEPPGRRPGSRALAPWHACSRHREGSCERFSSASAKRFSSGSRARRGQRPGNAFTALPDRAGSRPTVPSGGCTATRRCSSAACGRCCCSRCTRVAMTAIAQHSDYRDDPWGRLQRTSTFLAATTFGAAAGRAAGRGSRPRHPRPGHRDRPRRPCPTGPTTRTCSAGCTSRRRTASCVAISATANTRSTTPGATATSATSRGSRPRLACRIRRIPGPNSTPRCVTYRARNPRHPAGPRGRAVPDLRTRRCRLPPAARTRPLAAAAIAELPDWARRELRLPWLPLAGPVLAPAAGHAIVRTIRWAMRGRPQ